MCICKMCRNETFEKKYPCSSRMRTFEETFVSEFLILTDYEKPMYRCLAMATDTNKPFIAKTNQRTCRKCKFRININSLIYVNTQLDSKIKELEAK